ncbi:MAG: flagellar biosynthesis anti-sigma factor FlgM [Lachnospiraceae bacterium]
MRVEAYNQVAQIYNTSKTGKMKSTERTGRRDEVQISQAGRDYQVAKQAVAETSDIREDKVAQLKLSMESGNYKVTSQEFASKLIQKYNAYL